MVWNSKTLTPLFTKTYEKTLNILAYEDSLIISVDKGLTELHFGNSNVPNQSSFSLPSTGLARNFISTTSYNNLVYLIGTDGGEICIFEKSVFKGVTQVGKGRVSSIVIEGQLVYTLVGDEIVKLQLNQGVLS